MREIKFRAWDTEQANGMYELRSVAVGELGNRENEIVMQFTGLKDKNGKSIYEGDIVGSADARRLVVTFQEAEFFPFGSNPDAWQATAIEVIGNIYENPELTKQANE